MHGPGMPSYRPSDHSLIQHTVCALGGFSLAFVPSVLVFFCLTCFLFACFSLQPFDSLVLFFNRDTCVFCKAYNYFNRNSIRSFWGRFGYMLQEDVLMNVHGRAFRTVAARCLGRRSVNVAGRFAELCFPAIVNDEIEHLETTRETQNALGTEGCAQ